MNNKAEIIKRYLTFSTQNASHYVSLNDIADFSTIFSYINSDLQFFKEWVDEIVDFYSAIKFDIVVFANGKYDIEAFFPEYPDKEADEVFEGVSQYLKQRAADYTNPDDLDFLIKVWDLYFPDLYNQE